jgi:ATP-binding protein involved in chromosome partitioning
MTDQIPDETNIRDALSQFRDPETGRSITQLGQLHALNLERDQLAVTLGLTTWSAPLWEETRNELASFLSRRFPSLKANIELAVHERKPEKLGDVGLAAKTTIAVGSGKGGVGKSSVAAYLAIGLVRAGCRVGLMDADVYGPSIPHLLGSTDRPVMLGNRIQPVTAAGMKVMSMGFLVPPGEAVVWRGPMLHTALTQFLRDTEWGDLDYLIIDMPPGTGDIALSLSQLLPLTGAVVVCTPQDVALLDAVKAVRMFQKVNIDVLGMVENMSFFVCPNCDARHDIFGSGGARRKAEVLDVPFLGELPLITALREFGDAGQVGRAFDHEVARPYLESLCHTLVKNLATRHIKKPPLPSLTILK